MEKSRPNKIACADGTGPRETRETIVIVNAVESRGAAFFPRRHTHRNRDVAADGKHSANTYICLGSGHQDRGREKNKRRRDGGKREKRRGATNMLQDVAP